MKRILFVAELGSGFGHVRRLLPLARAAARLGHQPVFLVANPTEAALVLQDSGIPVAQAPFLAAAPRRSSASEQPARSFADLLLRAGFDDEAVLSRALETWGRLVDSLRPDAAVCELSPFFCLATHGSALPVLVSGHGFVLPPPELPRFPLLRAAPGGADDEAGDENRMLAATHAVLLRHGRPALPALPALFRGTTHAVTGLEALDPYRTLRASPAVGPPGVATHPDGEPPLEDLFGYLLGEAPGTLPLLQALGRSGAGGRVFVRRPTEAQRRALAGTNLGWVERPQPIEAALARARLIVHHGSMLTTEESLLGGRPQVVLPIYLEHLLTARALLDLGVARVARPRDASAELDALVTSALAGALGGAAAQAQAVARALARPPPDLADRLLRAIV